MTWWLDDKVNAEYGVMQIQPIGARSGPYAAGDLAALGPVEAVERVRRVKGGVRSEQAEARDEVALSDEARAAAAGAEPEGGAEKKEGQEGGDPTRPAGLSPKEAGGQELTEEELAQIESLSSRDREVRAHEQAHLAAAGGYATGGPTFTYQTGPDGKRYAVGGEVGIDTSPVSGNPRATLRKAVTIIAAANAPAEPSGQDRAVAAAAASMAARAQAELAQAAAVAQYQKGGQGESASPGGLVDIAA